MKKVYVLTADSYDDSGHYEGTSTEGIYATFELATKAMSELANPKVLTFDQYIADHNVEVRSWPIEKQEKAYFIYTLSFTHLTYEYHIHEHELHEE
jgi:hypothetical protein